jgi:hypothetical protein
MTPTEKAAYADRANSLGLSLGQFFREAGAAYAHRNAEAETRSLAEAEALEAALRQLELSTSRTEQTLDVALNDKVEEMAGLMKEQQRRLDDLQGRVIRLETVLELALHRSSGASGRLLEANGDPTEA